MESSCWLSRQLVCVNVGLCVSLSLRKVYCGKTADRFQMPFGVVSEVGQGMGVLNGDSDRWRRRGSFGNKFGASHCNQWGLCCIVVWKCVNRLSCHLGWEWGQWMDGCIRWGHMSQGKGAVSGGFLPHWFEWCIFRTEMYLTAAWKVDNISLQTKYCWKLESMIHWLSKDSEVRGQCWVCEKYAKM